MLHRPTGSNYDYGRLLVAIWAPKVHTIPLLGPSGLAKVMRRLRAYRVSRPACANAMPVLPADSTLEIWGFGEVPTLQSLLHNWFELALLLEDSGPGLAA